MICLVFKNLQTRVVQKHFASPIIKSYENGVFARQVMQQERLGGWMDVVSEYLCCLKNDPFLLPSEVYYETKSRATFLIRLKKSVFLNNRGPEGRKPGSASTRFFWIISANILGAIHLISPHQHSESFALEEELKIEHRMSKSPPTGPGAFTATQWKKPFQRAGNLACMDVFAALRRQFVV